MKTFPLALAISATLGLASSAAAQTCPDAADTFYKNDVLPDVPTGAFPIAIVPGLCEGEGAAQVFDRIGAGPQQITQVACPYTSPSGTGLSALVNVQIFDDVTLTGGVPDFSNKVFDLVDDTGNDLQVFEGGLNTFDMTPYGVTVSGSKFAVAFVMSFNPNGNCTSGFTSNFFTDNTTCPSGTSMILIQGQGWVDAGSATVSGFSLCPLFYAGDWAIRCCTTTDPAATLTHLCIQTVPHYAGGVVDLLASTSGTGIESGVHVEAQNGPPGEFGFLLISSAASSVTPLFQGVLCLGSPLGRYNGNIATNQGLPELNSIGQFDGAGVLVNIAGTSTVGTGFDVPLALPFTPGGQTIQSGETWYVQLWYRDQVGVPPAATPSANFSNVMAFTMP